MGLATVSIVTQHTHTNTLGTQKCTLMVRAGAASWKNHICDTHTLLEFGILAAIMLLLAKLNTIDQVPLMW